MPAPSINGVRLATLNDLHRISIVAAAAFFFSPTFRFQRPRYREFPADTVASYRIEYENAINDPAFVVLVAEDILESDEAEHVYDELRFACPASCAGKKGIVGICSFKLKPGSCYAGHLQPAGKHVSAERYSRATSLKFCQVLTTFAAGEDLTIARETNVLRP